MTLSGLDSGLKITPPISGKGFSATRRSSAQPSCMPVASLELFMGATVTMHHPYVSDGVGVGFFSPTFAGEFLPKNSVLPGGLSVVVG